MRKIKKNVQGFKKDERLTRIMQNFHKDHDMDFIGVYKYKKLEIHFSVDNVDGGKRHASIHNNVKWGEIYDDDLERIAKKFMKDKEWYIEKGVIGGIVHIWEK